MQEIIDDKETPALTATESPAQKSASRKTAAALKREEKDKKGRQRMAAYKARHQADITVNEPPPRDPRADKLIMPCKFCAGMGKESKGHLTKMMGSETIMLVMCYDCGATGPNGEDKRSVVLGWNAAWK